MRSDPRPSLRGFVAGFVVALAATSATPVWAETSEGEQEPICQCVCGEETGAVDDGDEVSASVVETSGATDDATPPIAEEEGTAAETSAEEVWPQIIISELLPDPVGTDTDGEFIEIRNLGPDDASLNGWHFVIGTKSYALPKETIGAGGHRYFLYVETKLQLTNSGLTLQLSSPDNVGVSVASYSGTAKTGKSWARDDSGAWSWTTPTPGAANVFEEPEAVSRELEDGGDAVMTPVTNEGVAGDAGSSGDTDAADQLPVSDGTTTETAPDSRLPALSFQLHINELLPDPAGSDDHEWIELANSGDVDAFLDGWTIDDDVGGSKPYAFKSGMKVTAGGYLVLPKSLTALGLNNDGDAVRLFRPDGTLADSTEYRTQAKEGKSWARSAAGWGWAEPTPGAANVAEVQSLETRDQNSGGMVGSVSNDGGAATTTPAEISDLAEMDDGEEAAVIGVVSLPPGVIGKTLFAIQDEAGTAGVIVRYYGKVLPALAVGDTVVLNGRLSSGASGRRLGVPADGLTVIGQAAAAAAVRDLVDISLDDQGLTVDVAGEVTAKGSGWLKISDAGGETEVKLILPAGAAVSAAVGDAASARGVVRFRNGTAEIVLNDRKELKTTPKPAVSDAEPAAAEFPNLVPAAKSASRRWLPLLFLIPAAGLAVVWQFQRRRSMAAADN